MKVGVVSQQVLFRKALCALLAEAGLFAGVMECDSVLSAVGEDETSQLLILLVHTTECHSGIDWICQLRDVLPESRAILLVDQPEEEYCVRALESGAWGCLSTADSPQVLLKAVAKVAEGERWFAHRVTSMVLEKLVASQGSNSVHSEKLTPREWEVLALLARGYAYKGVANELFISRETARSHVKSIYKKLQVSTRRAAAVYYFRHIRRQTGRLEAPEALPVSEVVSH